MAQYIVSARKYRPDSFGTLIGQDNIAQTLKNSILRGQLAHAYLFCGPRGVGKTTTARIFAKMINCSNPSADMEPCGQCESCLSFAEGRSYCIHELDAASNNGVEDIKTLMEQVRIPPQVGRYSVYIIDEVHMLSQGAFNALLKTLEEPPSYAIFILATTEKHKVLPTILSRCQVYDFSRITVADTIRHLQYVAQKEGINASEEALNVVAQKADGGMRDALSIFDQLVSFCGTTISYEQAIEVLNVLDTEYYFRLVNAALAGNVSEALLLLNEVLTKGFDAGHFVTGLAQHLRDVLVSKDAAIVKLLETSDTIRQHYQEQAQRCAAKWIFNALDIVNTCDINYRTAKNKRLTVELALVKLCRLTEVPTQEVQQVQKVQPVQKVQAAAPATQAAPQPATAPQPVSAPKPVTAAAPPPPRPTIGAMPSLGNLGKLTSTPQATAQPTAAAPKAEEQKRNNPFTLDQLKSAWVGQIKNFQSEERFKAMLTTYELVQDSETKFHITVDNQLQKKEFAKFSKQLMDNIRAVLQNDLIQLKVEVADYVATQVAYTSTEKYKLLKEQNPHLDELRQRMNLQLE